jgi:hypothetical protein
MTMGRKLAGRVTASQKRQIAASVRLAKMNKAKDALKTKQARAAADRRAKEARAKATNDLGSPWAHLADK